MVFSLTVFFYWCVYRLDKVPYVYVMLKLILLVKDAIKMNVYLCLKCVAIFVFNLEIHHMIYILRSFRQTPQFKLVWREFVGYHSQARHGFKWTTIKMLFFI